LTAFALTYGIGLLIRWPNWDVRILMAIYPTAILVGLAAARISWKRDEAADRRQKGLCPKCGYDLTGNVTGVCPECGTKR